jgi:hypothetical protein
VQCAVVRHSKCSARNVAKSQLRRFGRSGPMSVSLIGRLGSSAFRLSTFAASGSLAGACFSPESAHRPFHHGIRERGGTISSAALPVVGWQIQTDIRTHLIHRPARDTIPPLGGARGPPTLFGFANCSRGCSLSCPTELSAVNPDAVHDHRQPARQCDDRLLSPAVTSNLHRPGFEP